MKKILIPVLALAAVAFTACNQDLLEITQKGVVSTETFYQTDEDAEAAMVAAYQGLLWNVCSKEGGSIYAPFRACFNLPGDDVLAAGEFYGDNDFMREMDEFTYSNSCEVLRNCYNNIWYAMYYSNLVIHYFKDGLPDVGPTKVTKRVVGEARVLRAWMHLMLAIGWDVPPVAKDILSGSASPYNCNTDPDDPMTHDELLAWCAKECEDAAPDLDERSSPNDKDGAVKVTKGFAWAVAGKAHLFAGNYAKAKEDLGKVISSGKYSLVPGNRYWENFHASGDANEEKVFEVNLELNASVPVWWDIVNRSTWMEANIWGWRSNHFTSLEKLGKDPNRVYTGGLEGWGGLGVPQSFADEFVANDGPDSYRLKATIIPFEEVVYETKYGSDPDNPTQVKEGDTVIWDDDWDMATKQASDKVGINHQGLYGQSFYLAKKQLTLPEDCSSAGSNIRINNFTIMRYAEVLLMYAEACVQTGDAGSALKVVNDIQKRAGSKTVSTSVDMSVIKREKKLELWLESCRWPDQVRWGDFDLAKKAGSDVPVLYDKLTRAPQSADQGVKWHKDGRFYTVSTHAAKDEGKDVGYKDKNKYFPFPDNVTNINPNITQNPGWLD